MEGAQKGSYIKGKGHKKEKLVSLMYSKEVVKLMMTQKLLR